MNIRGVAVALVAFLMLSACGSAVPTAEPTRAPEPSPTNLPSPNPSPSPSPLPIFQVTPESLRGVEVNLWHPWAGAPAQTLESLVADFNAHNPWGIQAKLSAPGGSAVLLDAVQQALQAGAPPELVAMQSYQLWALAAQGSAVVDLTPYMTDDQWGLDKELAEGLDASFSQEDLFQGKQLGLPAQRDAQVLFYNRTWAQALGFTHPPSNPEEFRQQACAAAKANLSDFPGDNDGTGGWIVSPDSGAVLSWLFSFGWQPPAGDEIPLLSTPQAEQALTFLRNLEDKGCAWQSRDPSPYDYFARRMALFYSGTSQDLPLQAGTLAASGSRDDWLVLPYPGTSGPMLLSSGPSYALLRTDRVHQLAAWLLLRWLLQPASQQAMLSATWGLPLSPGIEPSAAGSTSPFAQWTDLTSDKVSARQLPQTARWRDMRAPLEDAAQQMLGPYGKAATIPDILRQLDEFLAAQP